MILKSNNQTVQEVLQLIGILYVRRLEVQTHSIQLFSTNQLQKTQFTLERYLSTAMDKQNQEKNIYEQNHNIIQHTPSVPFACRFWGSKFLCVE